MLPKHPSESLTILTDLVLPSETNPLNNLFGGELLARMEALGRRLVVTGPPAPSPATMRTQRVELGCGAR